MHLRMDELLDALTGGDPRLESYVGTWMMKAGYAEIVVTVPTERELIDEETGLRTVESVVEIRNEGLGPVPVRLRYLEMGEHAEWQQDQFELEEGSITLWRHVGQAPLRTVQADPISVTWQAEVKNDSYPPFEKKPKSLPGQHRQLTEKDQARLESLLSGN